MLKPAAAYLRVSTDGQDTKSQRDKIEEYALANDYEVEKWFVDEALSGTLDDRPALLELKEWVPKNEGKSVLMVGIDRLARDFVIYADFSQLFNNYRINSVYLNCPKVGEPSIDTLLQNILAAFAAYEKDVIRDRMDRGKRFKIKSGIISAGGPALYGYKFRVEYYPTGKKDKFYEIEENEAENVRMVFRMLLTGRYKVQTIGRELTQTKIRRRNGLTRWASTTIRSMLTNTTYIGEYRYGKTKMSGFGRNRKEIPRAIEEQIKVKVPAIISLEDFENAQKILAGLGRGCGSNNKKHSYLLAGILKCGKCNYRYSGWKKDSKKEEEHYFYYRCNSINRYNAEGKHNSCGNPSIDGKRLEEVVWNTLAKILTNPKKFDDDTKTKENWKHGKVLAADLTTIKKLINNTQMEEDRIIDGYGKGLFSDDTVVKKRKKVKEELAALIQKEREIIDQLFVCGMEGAQIALDPPPTIKELNEYTFEQRQDMVVRYISEITVLPTSPPKIEITFNLPVKPKTIIVTNSSSPQDQEELLFSPSVLVLKLMWVWA